MQRSFKMMQLQISTQHHSYPVVIGSGAIHGVHAFIQENMKEVTNIGIIIDEKVADIYWNDLKAAFNELPFSVYIAPSGESAKTFDVYYDITGFLLEKKLDRKSLIIAIGGGAIGDLAGFVASTFMRGIPFIQIPTTILAHDSAVGGKVAINHPLGKNMIGAFHQPEAVFYDLEFLQSLSLQEKRSGFAEVIKHGLIHDEVFYAQMRNELHTLDELSPTLLSSFLTRGIEIKGEFVAADETEKGVRAYLNFGHTLGHAIEAEMGYGGWTHGESVAVGMIFALKLSQKKLNLSFNVDDFTQWLQVLGYTTTIPAHISHEKLLKRMKQDKKSVAGQVKFVLLTSIGNPVLEDISDEIILQELASFHKGEKGDSWGERCGYC